MSVILTGDAGRKAAEWRQASEATGIPLNVIALSSTAETDRWEAETILVRPDEHAAAVGNASLSQQAPEMLRMAAGQRKA